MNGSALNSQDSNILKILTCFLVNPDLFICLNVPNHHALRKKYICIYQQE